MLSLTRPTFQANLIYLSRVAGTVPVLPPFTSHIDGDKAPLPFSRVFDVPRMSITLDTPLVEWSYVKHLNDAGVEHERDPIGCWNVWEVQDVHSAGPRGSYTPILLDLGAFDFMLSPTHSLPVW